MAKSPFKLKSGNTTPFKQMGSAPMTRNQARRLSQRHMKDGAYTTMPGESRFQMHKRLRKAGTIGETTETYLGKHQAAEAKTRAEFKTRGKESRTRFVESVQDFGKGLKKAANTIIGKVGDTVEDLSSSSSSSSRRNRGGTSIQSGSDSWGTYERRTEGDDVTYWYKEGGEGDWKQATDEGGIESIETNIEFE